MNKLANCLTKNSFFSKIDDADLEELSTRLQVRLAWKGEVIVIEGDPCNSLGIVLSGQLSLLKYSRSGSYVTVGLVSPGDFFGEDVIFSNRSTYPLTIEAVSNSRIVFIPKDILSQLIARYPSLLTDIVRLLADRVRENNLRIATLAQKSLRSKIAAYLLTLLESEQEKDKATADKKPRKTYIATQSVELPVSKEMTARLLGMPRPSFSRELVRMEKDGLIRVSGRVIWLTNIAGLQGEEDEEDADDLDFD